MTTEKLRVQFEFDLITEYLSDMLSDAFFNLFMDQHPEQDIDDWTMDGPSIVFDQGKHFLEWYATVHYEENVEEEIAPTLTESIFEL